MLLKAHTNWFEKEKSKVAVLHRIKYAWFASLFLNRIRINKHVLRRVGQATIFQLLENDNATT